jgi:hypothetical protein
MFPRWFAKCSDSVLEHTQTEFDPHDTNVSFECRWRCTSCSHEVSDSEVEYFAPRRAELWVGRAIEKLDTQVHFYPNFDQLQISSVDYLDWCCWIAVEPVLAIGDCVR